MIEKSTGTDNYKSQSMKLTVEGHGSRTYIILTRDLSRFHLDRSRVNYSLILTKFTIIVFLILSSAKRPALFTTMSILLNFPIACLNTSKKIIYMYT